MKIGLFGGSFNPVHNGHVRLAHNFADFLELDSLIIMPTGTPPHKSDKSFALPAHRLQMCRLAFEDERFHVSEMEILRGGKSYTIDTIKQLKCEYPQAELFLLMGSDMLFYFDKWYKYEEIMSLVTICAVSRLQTDDYDKMRDYARKVLDDKKDEVIIMKSEAFEISSSEIRDRLGKGLMINAYLPEKVAEYIQSRGLYFD